MKPQTAVRLARGISWALHPSVLPLYLLALLLTATPFALFPARVKIYLCWVVVLYAVVLPALSTGLLRTLGCIPDLRLDGRRERVWPLVIGTVCYVLCAVTIAKIPQMVFLRKFMLAAACCEAMCLVVSLRWKISLHMTAMGAAAALLTVMNVVAAVPLRAPLAAVIAASGMLASARLYLGCHNAWQILAGFGGGFVVAALALLFL